MRVSMRPLMRVDVRQRKLVHVDACQIMFEVMFRWVSMLVNVDVDLHRTRNHQRAHTHTHINTHQTHTSVSLGTPTSPNALTNTLEVNTRAISMSIRVDACRCVLMRACVDVYRHAHTLPNLI